MTRALLLAALLLAGCYRHLDPRTGVVTFDPRDTFAERVATHRALLRWRDALGDCWDVTEGPDGWEIRREPAGEGLLGHTDYVRGFSVVNPGLGVHTMMHELGHALGRRGHSTQAGSLMLPSGSTSIDVDEETRRIVREKWDCK